MATQILASNTKLIMKMSSNNLRLAFCYVSTQLCYLQANAYEIANWQRASTSVNYRETVIHIEFHQSTMPTRVLTYNCTES